MLKTKSSLDTEHYYFVYCLFVQIENAFAALSEKAATSLTLDEVYHKHTINYQRCLNASLLRRS